MTAREFNRRLRDYLEGFGAPDGDGALRAVGQRRYGSAVPRATAAIAVLTAVAMVVALTGPRWLPAVLRHTDQGPRTAYGPPPSPSVEPTSSPSQLVIPLRTDAGRNAVFDWRGRRIGTFTGSPTGSEAFSPDGSMALATTTDHQTAMFDASGRSLGAIQASDPFQGRWGTDSRHFCVPGQGPDGLFHLVVYAVDPRAGVTGQRTIAIHDVAGAAARLAVCSPATMRAVFSSAVPTDRTSASGSFESDITVIDLGTGATILHEHYPPPAPFANLVVSADGLYAAGYAPGGTDPARTTSVVIDLTSGKQVATVQGVVEAFTGDDRYVAVSSFTSELARTGGTSTLVEWRSGRIVWQGAGQMAILGVEPGHAGRVAVQLYSATQEPPDHDTWVIVSGDGRAVTIKQG